MLRLSNKITIGAELLDIIIFDFVNDIEIEESWENLTDTARVVVPRKLSFNGKPIAIGSEAIFKRGLSIKIEQGYDDNLKVVFDGFISKVHLSLPITLDCEDKMYLLKKNTLKNKSYSSVSLEALLKYIIPTEIQYTTNGFTFENLGQIRISNNATSAMVLDMLRKTYQIYSYFRDGKLYVGLAYQKSLQRNKAFGFEKNIIEDKGLEWENSEDVKIKVKGVSVQSDNTKREYAYPSIDAEGQQMTVSVPNVGQADLEKYVKRYYDSFQYSGYKGSFTTFGEPLVNHGDVIKFTGEKLTERNEGSYLVRSVKRSFSMNGYRQVIELANKLTNG
jgi:hypothetical protein